MSPDSPRYLHVSNGTSVTMTLEAAGVPGHKSIWADVLHDGPVPAELTDDELLEVRRQFHLAPTAPGRALNGYDPARDPVNDMRAWRDAVARHESYDELVLWFEHDLFDQLNLIHLLTFVRDRVPSLKPVSLICIGSFPGHPRFKGLGELAPEELAPLLGTRAPVTDAQFMLARRAWTAFREPTPEALDGLRRGDTAPLPFLGDAVTRLLEEYPWTTDGLSRTERRLLALAREGPITLAQAFGRMGDDDRVYTITDAAVADTADALARTIPPLATFERETDGHLLHGTLRSTPEGASVLAGRLDRVGACGIDRWIGGVHLQGRSNVWRWNPAQQRIERG
jgi:hypothetical protein